MLRIFKVPSTCIFSYALDFSSLMCYEITQGLDSSYDDRKLRTGDDSVDLSSSTIFVPSSDAAPSQSLLIHSSKVDSGSKLYSTSSSSSTLSSSKLGEISICVKKNFRYTLFTYHDFLFCTFVADEINPKFFTCIYHARWFPIQIGCSTWKDLRCRLKSSRVFARTTTSILRRETAQL